MKGNEVLIEAIALRKSYENGKIEVLKGADIQIPRGKTVALCGPSGGGKSTLLHILAGVDSADSGQVLIDGKSIDTENSRTMLLRKRVGFVFQLHNLIPGLTLEENCMIPAVAAGVSTPVARQRLTELLEKTGISHRRKNRIQDLSGGERQRTAICRALMNQPDIIIADEPTGALDENSREGVFRLLMELVHDEGATLLMATHDKELAARCDSVFHVRNGVVEK